MPPSLFEALDIERPAHPLPPFGLLLVPGQNREATERMMQESSGSILWEYLSVARGNFLRPEIYEEALRANQELLNQEMGIDIDSPVLTGGISRLYEDVGVKQRLSQGEKPDTGQMAAIAIKLGLDFAQGNHPKVVFGDDPREFIPVPLHHQWVDRTPQTEAAIGRILKIIEEAQDAGYPMTNVIGEMMRLTHHMWRSSVKQALANAKRNLELQDSGIRLVRAGTNTPIGRLDELRAVQEHIKHARRRIGDAVSDLEEEFKSMAPRGVAR